MNRNDGRPRIRSYAFTLIEMTVVLALIAALSAIAATALMHSREMARVTTCANHLNQYGIAIHGYESANGHLPGGQMPRKPKTGDRRPTPLGPHRELLGWLSGVEYVFGKFTSASLDHLSPAENELERHVIPLLMRCPSDGGADAYSYRFCTGQRPNPVAAGHPGRSKDEQDMGAFPWVTDLTTADIRDGMSATVAMSERIAGRPTFAKSWYLIRRSELGRDPSADSYAAHACGSVVGPPTYRDAGRIISIVGNLVHTHYNHVATPNSVCFDVRDSPSVIVASSAARSFHAGFVNVLMLDGSVVRYSDSVDLVVWRRAAVIADER